MSFQVPTSLSAEVGEVERNPGGAVPYPGATPLTEAEEAEVIEVVTFLRAWYNEGG